MRLCCCVQQLHKPLSRSKIRIVLSSCLDLQHAATPEGMYVWVCGSLCPVDRPAELDANSCDNRVCSLKIYPQCILCFSRNAVKRGTRLRPGTTAPGKRHGRKLLGPDGASFRPYYSSVGAACPSPGFSGSFPAITSAEGMGELVWDGRVCANQPAGTVRGVYGLQQFINSCNNPATSCTLSRMWLSRLSKIARGIDVARLTTRLSCPKGAATQCSAHHVTCPVSL